MKTGGAFLTTRVAEEEVFTREQLSAEQQEIARTVEQFATGRILPNKSQIEKFDKELSRSLLRECGELGLLGVDVPEKYGGLGLDKVTSMLVAEKMAMGECASFVATVSAHSGIGTLPIVFFGNEAQKQKYLPKLATGEWVAAYALTEPEAGSDALGGKTTALLSPDGKHYLLTGTKQFITNGNWADLYITFGNVNGKMTGFIVEAKTPGLRTGPEEHKMGLKGSSTCSVILEDARVPVENLLGEVGRGHEIAFNTLNLGRLKLGAADLGGCKACVNEAVTYALQRRQFGQPIARFDIIRRYFADMVIRAFALDSIIYRTAGLIDEAVSTLQESSPGYQREVAEAIERFAIEASICKVYGTEALWFNSDMGLQIFGGYGFIEDYPMASAARDTRVDRIFEGTNEINRQIITGYFLRKALMEELPIREAIKKVKRGSWESGIGRRTDELAAEKHAVELAKALALYLFDEAICNYGQGLRNEQQVGEVLSNLFIDLYVMDSVLSRVAQYLQRHGRDPIWLAIAQVLCAERVAEMALSTRKALCSMLEGNALAQAMAAIQSLSEAAMLATNQFALKQQIAEDLYEHGRYRF